MAKSKPKAKAKQSRKPKARGDDMERDAPWSDPLKKLDRSLSRGGRRA